MLGPPHRKRDLGFRGRGVEISLPVREPGGVRSHQALVAVDVVELRELGEEALRALHLPEATMRDHCVHEATNLDQRIAPPPSRGQTLLEALYGLRELAAPEESEAEAEVRALVADLARAPMELPDQRSASVSSESTYRSRR
jgi:hypothetical protein